MTRKATLTSSHETHFAAGVLIDTLADANVVLILTADVLPALTPLPL